MVRNATLRLDSNTNCELTHSTNCDSWPDVMAGLLRNMGRARPLEGTCGLLAKAAALAVFALSFAIEVALKPMAKDDDGNAAWAFWTTSTAAAACALMASFVKSLVSGTAMYPTPSQKVNAFISCPPFLKCA